MPIAEKYTLAEIMEACAHYAKSTNYRRITFEYIMLRGINDSLDDARRLVNMVKRYNVPAKFNLIPFNYWDGCVFKESTEEIKILGFAKYITDAKYPCPVRFSRGSDISAACGQLRGKK
jgi:23S rRNA (adenine2503-C2)-methyltransferase